MSLLVSGPLLYLGPCEMGFLVKHYCQPHPICSSQLLQCLGKAAAESFLSEKWGLCPKMMHYHG